MDKGKISMTCISMAKDMLEIATHADRDDMVGIANQFDQIQEKLPVLKNLLDEKDEKTG